MRIALIDGWWGTGKSVLRGILDGHPEVFVSPIQDSLPGGFALDKTAPLWLKNRDIEALRELLAGHTCYYRIERFAQRQSIHNDTSKAQRVFADFHLDFNQMDALMVERLNQLSTWTPEAICTEIYQAFRESWSDYPPVEPARWAVSMDNNRRSTPKYLMEHFPNARLLYVRRAPEGILATRAGRKPIASDYRSENWESLTVRQLIVQGEVERIVRMQQSVEALQKQYSDRILILDFEEIIVHYQTTAKKLAEFLGIADHASLYQFSYCGREIRTSNDEQFLGKVNDDPENILSRSELATIRKLGANPSRWRLFQAAPQLGAARLAHWIKEFKAKLQ